MQAVLGGGQRGEALYRLVKEGVAFKVRAFPCLVFRVLSKVPDHSNQVASNAPGQCIHVADVHGLSGMQGFGSGAVV